MLFRLRQPLPMLLALLRDLDSKTLKPRMVLRGLRVIENFHFVYTAVASRPSSGGVSGMYARSARELLAARIAQAKANVLTELENKLRQRLPVVRGVRGLVPRAAQLTGLYAADAAGAVRAATPSRRRLRTGRQP